MTVAGAREITIGVDARALHATGIGRYLREVLARLFADSRFGRVLLLGARAELEAYVRGLAAELAPKAVIESHDGGFYSVRAQLSWLALAVAGKTKADVWFFPHLDVPVLMLPRRTVVTVHDLTHSRVPGAFPWKQRFRTSALLTRAALSARWIITDSESTRRDLGERFPVAVDKATTVPLGVGAPFEPCRSPEAAPPHTHLPTPPYLLYVGNRKPHKNLGVLVESLAQLRRERPELRLVLAGGRDRTGWGDVLDRAQRLGVADAIDDVGEVSDDELRSLYGRCEALVFPSLYEGFGLPVLEAMACGAPVVASNRASLPEAVGGAGFLVDPLDPRGFVEALTQLDRDPALRAEMVRRGRDRAAEFSWERTAHQTLDVLYRAAVDR